MVNAIKMPRDRKMEHMGWINRWKQMGRSMKKCLNAKRCAGKTCAITLLSAVNRSPMIEMLVIKFGLDREKAQSDKENKNQEPQHSKTTTPMADKRSDDSKDEQKDETAGRVTSVSGAWVKGANSR